ncbi:MULTISPECIES: LacI family DNA-binding transcriptional regulator [Butyrivibrio]|jgi:DNA-binding LacI/PurR family transcriptional regulator|uniref:LacI family DNA-binding transcriptional regulator n=1 Tax=Butyrivibrio TaxID=830 RepID=UPI0004288377|nr:MULTISPECIES: LacI family DNA-binding transcriptional regulator [Butyrivibrio]SEQ62033.1 LacI family transcriptional regulator [Butyrivibrio sp. TB]
MSKKITMSDIAKELGISTVTVSKALSGQKGVGEQMRQRIIEIANERGYQKSVSIEANESYKIGVLIGSRYVGNIDSFYGHMYQIFSAKAAKIGSFTMLEILSDDDEKNLVYPKIIGDGNVDAVVIMGALGEEYLNMLDEKLGTPTFYMDFTDRKHKKDSVISGSFYGSYILTNYLFDKGHTQIGYVGTVLSTPSITDRYLGYVRAMMEHGIDIKKEWILNDRSINNDKVDIENNLVLPKGKLPTAFVCNCDLTANVFMQYLKVKGYKVPEDISLVGYDDFLFADGSSIGITTYKVDMDEMVKRTLKRITHVLRGEKYRGGLSIVEGYLIERDSVKDLNRSKK